MYAPINTQKGFVALITAIIVAVSLLTLVIAVGFEGFQSRFTVFESDLKEKSIHAAESCAYTAILELAQGMDPLKTPIETVGDNECEIVSVSAGNDLVTTQSVVDDAVTNLEVGVDPSKFPDVVITSWSEIE